MVPRRFSDRHIPKGAKAMQASLARWAVVTLSTLGAIGCQGAKPGWWPGHKGPVYSNSSTTPPAGLPQQPPYSQQGQQQPQLAPAYMDQAGYAQPGAQGAAGGYSTAGAYPIGSANPQDQYAGMGGGATGASPYDQAYTQQQPAGAYPENYQTGAGAAGGYAGQPAGYSQAQPYSAPGGTPYAGANPAGGYEQARTADARYQAGAAGGYGTSSPYDTNTYNGGYSGQDLNAQPAAAAGGYQQPPTQTEQQYQPGNTGYQPGNTGYAPPGTAPYQSPGGGYSPDPNATSQAEPHYRPGSTSDYSPATSPAATTASTGLGSATGTASAPAVGGRYPQTGGGPATDGYAAQPQVDRYGRPIQEASGAYGGTMQR